jgi:hypothetical protein
MQPGTGKYVWLLPTKPECLLPIAGEITVNTGLVVEAVLSQPKLTLPAKYVSVVSESKNVVDILKTWEKVTGKQAIYVEASDEAYGALYGPYGTEIADQFRFLEASGSWETLQPEDVFVTIDQLGLSGKLIGHEQALTELKAELI